MHLCPDFIIRSAGCPNHPEKFAGLFFSAKHFFRILKMDLDFFSSMCYTLTI